MQKKCAMQRKKTLVNVVSAIILLAGFIRLYQPLYAASTADPMAMNDAKKILNYYYSLTDKKDTRVISGQMANWGNSLTSGYQNEIVALQNQTGKWVSLIGTDWHNFGTPTKAFVAAPLINWWKAGGLVTVDYHMDNPFGNGSAWSKASNLTDPIKTGTAANKNWLATLDWTASCLKTLQDAGVIVLWRPFHEMNGSWFWWGKASNPDDFMALWRHMFNYFTVTKGLHNILWVYGPNIGSDVTKYYPGDSYVDIVGLDGYFSQPSSINITNEYNSMLTLKKPLGFTEFGGIPAAGGDKNVWDNSILIRDIKAKYPKMCFFYPWHCSWSIVCQKNASALLNDPWVITRDKLSWKDMSVDVSEARTEKQYIHNKQFTVSYVNGFIRFDRRIPQNSKIDIITAQGRIVGHYNCTQTESSMLAVGNLSKSVYFVKIITSDRVDIQKIVVP